MAPARGQSAEVGALLALARGQSAEVGALLALARGESAEVGALLALARGQSAEVEALLAENGALFAVNGAFGRDLGDPWHAQWDPGNRSA